MQVCLLAFSNRITAQGPADLAFVDSVAPSQVAVRTNLLWWGTLTPNVGVDFRLSPKWSLGVNAGLNPWTFSENKKWKHLLIAPELRHWNKQTFQTPSSYWGLNAFYSHYNVGHVKFPFGLYREVRDHRLQGDLVALGLFYGRTWRLSRLFRMEAELGLGGGYTWYDKFECAVCGTKVGDDRKAFLVPKLALNLVLDPGRKVRIGRPVIIEPVDTVVPEKVEVLPVLKSRPLKPQTQGDVLMADNAVLQEFSHYKPYDRTRVMRRDSGALFVHFTVGKAELGRGFRQNAETLDRIVSITRQIMADPKSNVRLIQIIGFASIEGRVQPNEQLAQQRAEALKRYVQQQTGAADSLFELNNGGEAWAEFRDQVEEMLEQGRGDAAQLRQVLAVISEEPDADRREQRLRRLNGGRTWQYIKQSVLADQRNSGYLRIYFDRVPDRQAEQINRAAALLQQERYDEALSILNKVREDQRSWNALGVALYMTGHRAEALDYFQQAAAQGDADAQENLRQLEDKR